MKDELQVGHVNWGMWTEIKKKQKLESNWNWFLEQKWSRNQNGNYISTITDLFSELK